MENKVIINNEFDYSNKMPIFKDIAYLIKYIDSIYISFMKLIENDEKRNEQLKAEYRTYKYKKNYGTKFEIYIRLKTYNNIICKSYEEFENVIKNKILTNILELDINLNLDYKCGKGYNLEEFDNSFSIIIKPYDFIFARKSSHDDADMNQIEININKILNNFLTINTIFCSK